MYYTILYCRAILVLFGVFSLANTKVLNFFLFFFEHAATVIVNRKQFLFGRSLCYNCVKNGSQKDSFGVPD